jgi:hypothetical protein
MPAPFQFFTGPYHPQVSVRAFRAGRLEEQVQFTPPQSHVHRQPVASTSPPGRVTTRAARLAGKSLSGGVHWTKTIQETSVVWQKPIRNHPTLGK